MTQERGQLTAQYAAVLVLVIVIAIAVSAVLSHYPKA